MISIIITAYKEPRTIGHAIDSVISQTSLNKCEILVVAPDQETLRVAQGYKQSNVKFIKDSGKGKPAALNHAVSRAKGDILILTDGDVFVKANSLKYLIDPYKNPKIGAVSGRPISTNSKKTVLGYWAYMLTEVAHERRVAAQKSNKNFFCSGYLFSIKKKLFPKLPEDLLSEDGYISYKVYASGKRIAYAPQAEVYVKYPSNFKDWISQKRRSAGGYVQIKDRVGVEIRSMKKESFGALQFFRYVKSLSDFISLVALYIARIYLWIVIFRDVKIKNKPSSEIWVRVESTK